jgi:hypothetical protein
MKLLSFLGANPERREAYAFTREAPARSILDFIIRTQKLKQYLDDKHVDILDLDRGIVDARYRTR